MTGITIGFIGTGAMGEPMCGHVATRGQHRVVALDLDPAPLERLAAHGVETAPDPETIARSADVIILSLPGGPEVEAVCERLLPELGDSAIVIDMSTTPVRTTRALAGKFAARNIGFLDAPVARTRQAAIDGNLSIMVGGDAVLLDRVRDILSCMGPDISHCGPAGCGQIAKILNNMVVFQNGVAVAEAIVIAERAGMNGADLLDVINKSSGMSFVGQNHGIKAMVPGRFPLRQFPVRYALKDLSYALMLADDGDVPVPGAELARDLLERATAAGLGEEYWPTIINVVRGKPREDRN